MSISAQFTIIDKRCIIIVFNLLTKRNKVMMKMEKGFTLAEVLITLGIIGVVAALTIPTLMANYQKVQYVTGLKKAYAEVTEALKLMANDNGCPEDLKCTGIFQRGASTKQDDDNRLGNEFKKYFKLAKDCGTTYNANNDSTQCMTNHFNYNYDGSSPYYADLNTQSNYGPIMYRFITSDGFSIALEQYDYCDSDQYIKVSSGANLNQICGNMYIDVNGLKGPNCMGRDIFDFMITNGKGPAIYPQGGSEDPETSWENSSGTIRYCNVDHNGNADYMCAARIMEQGWQMLY